MESDKKERSSQNTHDSMPLDSKSLESQTADSNETKSTSSKETDEKEKPTLGIVVSGANDLSVGISIVVAVLLGIGIGILLERVSGQKWLFWLGVVWGVAAAILNLYRAYKRAQKEAQELAANPRYSYNATHKDDEDSQNGVYY